MPHERRSLRALMPAVRLLWDMAECRTAKALRALFSFPALLGVLLVGFAFLLATSRVKKVCFTPRLARTSSRRALGPQQIPILSPHTAMTPLRLNGSVIC